MFFTSFSDRLNCQYFLECQVPARSRTSPGLGFLLGFVFFSGSGSLFNCAFTLPHHSESENNGDFLLINHYLFCDICNVEHISASITWKSASCQQRPPESRGEETCHAGGHV